MRRIGAIMLKPVYKIKHYYPVKQIAISVDGWWNPIETIPVEQLYWNKFEDPGDENPSDFFIFFL